jgi:hypothetical protein
MIDLVPGARVRVTAPGTIAGRLEGTVSSRTADSLVVLTNAPAQYRIALRSVESVEVSRGTSRSAGATKGALWGGGIGLAISIPLSGDAESRRSADGGTMSPANFIAIETIGGAMIGAAIGAMIGSEQWARYASPVRVNVGRNGGRVGAALSF